MCDYHLLEGRSMTPPINPTPVPEATVDAFNADGMLMIRHGVTLPPRCVFCNQSCQGSPNKLVFMPKAKLTLAGALGAVISGAISGVTVLFYSVPGGIYMIYIYRCGKHRAQTRMLTLIALMILGIAVFVAGKMAELRIELPSYLGISGFGLTVGLEVLAVLVILTFVLTRMRKLGEVGRANGFIFLKGACKEFMAELPSATVDPERPSK